MLINSIKNETKFEYHLQRSLIFVKTILHYRTDIFHFVIGLAAKSPPELTWRLWTSNSEDKIHLGRDSLATFIDLS